MSATDPFRCHPRTLARLPRIVRLYILHCLIGFALSAVFTAGVIGLDIAGIGHLVRSVSGGGLAIFVFFMLNGIVFAGVQTGIVVMSMDYDNQDPGRGRRVPVRQPVPVGVPQRDPNRSCSAPESVLPSG